MSAEPTTPQVRSLNVPNALTVFRIILVPVFLYLLLVSDTQGTALRYWALGVYIGAAITDLIDGDYARRTGQVTPFGQVADPIADKALIGAALIGLSWLGDLPWWVTGVILARELAVTVLRWWARAGGVIPASRGGKLKTVLQLFAVGFYLLPQRCWSRWSRPWTISFVLFGCARSRPNFHQRMPRHEPTQVGQVQSSPDRVCDRGGR